MLEESVLDGRIIFEIFEFLGVFGFVNFSRTSFFEKDFFDELNNLTRAEIFPIFSHFFFFCSNRVISSYLFVIADVLDQVATRRRLEDGRF